ncbi:MAG: hypothetical protein QNK89_08280 [Lacinutrix sp.]|uniref:hypothetical protein n=1 Tax=Lacinutrix sp. TaxID=1937692 RepID=UPI00309DD9B9
MLKPTKNKTFYAYTSIQLKDISNGPLANESIIITGLKNKKSIKTNREGKVYIYLPKGDTYTINFIYNKNYAKFNSEYSKGMSEIILKYSYLGTKEIERRNKIEALRIAEEEKRLKAEEERFKTKCELLKLTLEECKARELKEYIEALEIDNQDNIISKILERNNWTNKLIVWDLTGSMSPYTAELSIWYALNLVIEKNLQFAFFNDGDGINDDDKKIGLTSGVYYTNTSNTNDLNALIAKVSSAGSGGDCEENDMEALINATKMANPFKQLILIADADSPVRDIELLKDFKHPIHIILCGFDDIILEDYLTMAWKSKGSIHNILDDITKIANMVEGDKTQISSKDYKIMGGNFILLN